MSNFVNTSLIFSGVPNVKYIVSVTPRFEIFKTSKSRGRRRLFLASARSGSTSWRYDC